MKMHRLKLKSLDRIFILTLLLILGTASSIAYFVERQVESRTIAMNVTQLGRSSEMLSRSIKSELEAGNVRYAWDVLNQSVGYSGMIGFVILNDKSELAIEDKDFMDRYRLLLADNAWSTFSKSETLSLQLSTSKRYLIVKTTVSPGAIMASHQIDFIYDLSEIQELASAVRLIVLTLFGVIIVFSVASLLSLRRSFLLGLEQITGGVSSILSDQEPTAKARNVISEYFPAEAHIRNLREEFIKTKESLREQAVHAALGQMARQVSHDIRSPLSALNMVISSLSELPEEKRLIIRNATQRINDIANNLLQQGKKQQADAPNRLTGNDASDSAPAEPIMLATLLDAIVSEKRIQFRERMEVQISGDLDQGYGLFANLKQSDFARAISNLINNSVEAMEGRGQVNVALRRYTNHAVVIVSDDGKGIPSDVLHKIGTKGFSLGKDGTDSGSGLGTYHARETVERAGGKFSIQSQLGIGTIVTMTFPRVPTPSWFTQKISLQAPAIVASVDDDQTIHQIWARRLASIKAESPHVSHLSFSSLNQFESWFESHQRADNSLFLIDYEFLGQLGNGIDAIERMGIAKQAILVTSRYEEQHIRDRAAKLDIKILPKSLAPVVPLEFARA